jgi:hypothetical protein
MLSSHKGEQSQAKPAFQLIIIKAEQSQLGFLLGSASKPTSSLASSEETILGTD